MDELKNGQFVAVLYKTLGLNIGTIIINSIHDYHYRQLKVISSTSRFGKSSPITKVGGVSTLKEIKFNPSRVLFELTDDEILEHIVKESI